MPDRHSELPAHPDLEYYRKQAKHLLRSYEAGDAAARDRAAEVLGDRAAGRFLLSDAQFVLAQEHGFRTWAEFRADIQSQRTTGDRPVSPLWGGSSGYASQADGLLTELRRGDPDALQRLRAQVPRYAAATDASTAELRDARLVIAREAGFPTWWELVASAERSQRDEAEREENWRRMRPEAEALLAGDTARLAQLTAGQADILLQMLAGQEILGTRPGQELGAPRAAVDVLIGKATRLDLPLDRAARAGRVEYVRLLLDAGADPRSRTDGITPLESAIYFGRPPMIDLLAGHGIVPQGLWTYAACGRLDLVQACFDADGRLRPDAALSRPNTASFYPIPPRKPVSDDPEQIMAEAFVYACQHGRIEVVRWFLDRGLNPDAAPFFGRTGLLWAVMCQQPEVVRLLIERGADPSRREELIPFGAEGLVAVLFATDRHDPAIRQLHELFKPRSAELPPQVPSRRSPSVDRTTGAGRGVEVLAQAVTLAGFISAVARPDVLVIDRVQGKDGTLDDVEDVLIRGGPERVKLVLERCEGSISAGEERLRPKDTGVYLIRRARPLRNFGCFFLELRAPSVAWSAGHRAIVAVMAGADREVRPARGGQEPRGARAGGGRGEGKSPISWILL